MRLLRENAQGFAVLTAILLVLGGLRVAPKVYDFVAERLPGSSMDFPEEYVLDEMVDECAEAGLARPDTLPPELEEQCIDLSLAEGGVLYKLEDRCLKFVRAERIERCISSGLGAPPGTSIGEYFDPYR